MKIERLAGIFAALIVAACHSQPRPAATIERPMAYQPPPRQPGLGIDLPIDASDVLAELKDSRVGFVARYYRSPISHWPPLSASEAQRLSSMGFKIVAVWEPYSPDPQYYSYFTGYDDAISAYRQAKAIGQPPGSAIYFAIDFNAQALAPIEQYFRGAAAGLAAASAGRNEYKVGVYGSGAVCDAMKRAGLAQYAWLSNSIAWTGSGDYDDWNIRQGEPLADLSFNHDSDEARGDYGGFRVVPDSGPAPGGVAAPQTPQQGNRLTSADPAFTLDQ